MKGARKVKRRPAPTLCRRDNRPPSHVIAQRVLPSHEQNRLLQLGHRFG